MLLLRHLLSRKMSLIPDNWPAKKVSSIKQCYPSADRNKGPILQILQKYIDPERPAKLLEVSSGTGQHAAFFAKNFPKLVIQPSEYEEEMLGSIRAYAAEVSDERIRDPVVIDASTGPWPVDSDFDYILNVNMFHVTPFACSIGFFKYGSKALKKGGLIFTYGAYKINGVLEPQSNIDFDSNIRRKDPLCGIRDVRDLEKIANENGITLKHIHDMPANNKCCVWEKIKE